MVLLQECDMYRSPQQVLHLALGQRLNRDTVHLEEEQLKRELNK